MKTMIQSVYQFVKKSTLVMISFAMMTIAMAQGGIAPMGLDDAYEQYVKPNGAFTNDGTSWNKARNNVQDAINAAQTAIKNGVATTAVVYVAEGTYYPSKMTEVAPGTKQSLAIQIPAGITVKGGYKFDAGGNLVVDQDENPVTTGKTIFSGNHAYNTSVEGDRVPTSFLWNTRKQYFDTEFPDNSYHVVTFATNGFDGNHAKPLSAPARLENVTIQYGRAYNNSLSAVHPYEAYGAGVYMVEGAELVNCEVCFCVSSRDGGGVYMDGGGLVENCYIHHNQTLGLGIQHGYGGGVAIYGAGVVSKSWIVNNVGRMGGGLAFVNANVNDNANMVAKASLVANNTSTTEAGGVYMMNGGVLNNMSVYKNRCNGTGARINDIMTGRSGGVFSMGKTRIYDSALWGNTVGEAGGDTGDDLQYYAHATGQTRAIVKYSALSNSDRVSWSYANTTQLKTLALNNTTIKLNNVPANTGVLVADDKEELTVAVPAGADYRSAYDFRPGRGSLLLANGVRLSDMGESGITNDAFANTDILGNIYAPICDLGAWTVTYSVIRTGQTTLFVDPKRDINKIGQTEANTNYGESWDNPLSSLEEALEYFGNNPTNGATILIKEGTLMPSKSQSGVLREATFNMVSNVTIKGGYPSELKGTDLDSREGENEYDGIFIRNIRAYPTIIAGALNSTNYKTNVGHLITFGEGVTGVVLDGVQIRNANAFDLTQTVGGAIFADAGAGKTNTIRDCVIAGCSASNGAAVYAKSGVLNIENTIIHNNGLIDHGNNKTAKLAAAQTGVVFAAAGATVNMNHCDVLRNVGTGVYAAGQAAVNNSIVYANLNQEVMNTDKWNTVENSDVKLCVPVAGNVTVDQFSVFDAASITGNFVIGTLATNVPDAQRKLTYNQEDNSGYTYPLFKNATKTCGVSDGGDVTFYGNEANFSPSNMSPLTNAATATALNALDMLGNLRSFGGSADIGAVENCESQVPVELAQDAQGNYLNQIAYTPVLYVRDYHSYDAQGNRTATDYSIEGRDGYSWATAINGNGMYGYTFTEKSLGVEKLLASRSELQTYASVAEAEAANAETYLLRQDSHYLYATDNNQIKFNITDGKKGDRFAFISTGNEGVYQIYDVTAKKFTYWTSPTDNAKSGVKLTDDGKYDYSDKLGKEVRDWTGAQKEVPANPGFVERYSGNNPLPQGKVIYQTITGLKPGAYTVKFVAAANVARDLKNQYSGNNLAYIYANDTQQDINVGKNISSINPLDYVRTLTTTVGQDGKLEFGIANKQEAGQWYVVQAISLTYNDKENTFWKIANNDNPFMIQPAPATNNLAWNLWGGSGTENDLGLYNEERYFNFVIDLPGNITEYVESGKINGLQYAVNKMHDMLGLKQEPTVEYKDERGGRHSLNHFDLPEGREDGQVWVGAGTYTKPDGFYIRNHVKVYGGFPKVGNPGMKERHPQLTSDVAMSVENESQHLNYRDYETILQTKYSMTEELPNVVKPVSRLLSSEMYRMWSSPNADATINGSVVPANLIGDGKSYNGGTTIFGDWDVKDYYYVNLNGYKSIELRGVGKARLLFNRRVNKGNFITRIVDLSENGTILNLDDINSQDGYVHLNVIKIPDNTNNSRVDRVTLIAEGSGTEMTDFTADLDAMTAIVTAMDGNTLPYFASGNQVNKGTFTEQSTSDGNYYFMKFARVADASGCDYSNGNIYTIQMLNRNGKRYTEGEGFLNVQSVNGDRGGNNAGNVIFSGGWGPNQTDYGQDKNNFALWRVNYNAELSAFTLQNVGRAAEGSASYFDPATKAMVESPAPVRIFTQGVSVLSHPSECRPTLGYDVNEYENRIIYDGAEWDGFTLRYGYKNGVIRRDRNGGRRNSGAGASIYENATLCNCVVRDNYIGGASTYGRGGGIYVDGGSVLNCYVMENTSNCTGGENYGGGIYMITGTMYNTVITHNVLVPNNGGCHGAGIFMESASFYNNTIVHNDGGSAIGVYTSSTNDDARLTVYNTIVIGSDNDGCNDKDILWRASTDTPATFDHCYLQHRKDELEDTTNENEKYQRLNCIYGYQSKDKWNEFGPFVKSYNDAVAEYDYRITTENKGQVGDTKYNNNCVNAGTEDIGKDYTGEDAELPDIDMDYTDRIQDCRVDIGAYEFNGAAMITPTAYDADGNVTTDMTQAKKAYYYVSMNGRTTTAATEPEQAACWQKIQKVLDAAGRFKFVNPGVQVIVKLAGEETQASKNMKALYDDESEKLTKGQMFEFKYSPRNPNDLMSEDPRDYSLMVPRGVEVWGGYYVSNNANQYTDAPTKTVDGQVVTDEFRDDPYETYDANGNATVANEHGRSVTMHPTVLDGRYESSDRTQYVYAYHTLVFTDEVFDPTHKPYLLDDISSNLDKISTSDKSSYTYGSTLETVSLEARFAAEGQKTNVKAVVDGLFITHGYADGRESQTEIPTNTRGYGGAAVLTDFAHIRNCIVQDNKAANGGGAFLMEPGALISGTLIKQNKAANGGGIYFKEFGNGDVKKVENMARVYTTTIVDNTATGEGGGVWFNDNARINSTVIWGNNCGNMKNVFGQKMYFDEYAGESTKTLDHYAFNYSAVENMREPGVNNFRVAGENKHDVRFSRDMFDQNLDAKVYGDLVYYLPDTYSTLVDAGDFKREYEKLMTSDSLAAADFTDRMRINDDYNYITVGARVQWAPLNNTLITRLYVDANQFDDLDYEKLKYFNGEAEGDASNRTSSDIYSIRGSSNAYPMQDIQEALDYINRMRETYPDQEFEIIVARGTYYPSYSDKENADATDFTFKVPDNVKIAGGFKNGEYDNKFLGQPTGKVADSAKDTNVKEYTLDELLALRDNFDINANDITEAWEFQNQTIISGQVVNDEENGAQANHIFTVTDSIPAGKTAKGVTIDGLSIEKGNANGTGTDAQGGAILNELPLKVEKTTFLANEGVMGGAIASSAPLEVYASFFANNHADNGGGAIYSTDELKAVNVLFANNEAGDASDKSGKGGAIYSGVEKDQDGSSKLLAVNCDFVMNQAGQYPAIYTPDPTKATNQVINGVFWGNEATDTSNDNYDDILNTPGNVWYSAYEQGKYDAPVLNDDKRKADATRVEGDNLGLVNTGGLGQNSNIYINSDNDALDGPNFGHPSTAAGTAGYMQDANFMPNRENRLTDAGWGWIEQNAAGDGFASNAPGASFNGNGGGAYTTIQKTGQKDIAINTDRYMLLENGTNRDVMYRIELNPTPGSGSTIYIDLGVYEIMRPKMQTNGECIDELWVSTEQKLGNGEPDGRTWDTPTTDLQGAINTLLANRCGHHKIIHIFEGAYTPTKYAIGSAELNFEINNGGLNLSANNDGYELHLTGKKTIDNVETQVQEANPNAKPMVASLTIIGGYSKELSGAKVVNNKTVKEGVRNGEKYQTLLEAKYAQTAHVININDARMWYGKGAAEGIALYDNTMSQLRFGEDGGEPTVMPIVIEGISVKNALKNIAGAAINYVAPEYTTDGETEKIIYSNSDKPDGTPTSHFNVAAVVDGTTMPKLTVSHDIIYGSGNSNAESNSALNIGEGGGETLILNSLFHSNNGNPVVGPDVQIVNSTFGNNTKPIALSGNSSIFGSILWSKGPDGEFTGVADENLNWNAIFGRSETETDGRNNTGLIASNANLKFGPNFKDPDNADVDKRNFHLNASEKTLNIIAKSLYDAALGKDNTTGHDWYNAWLIKPYVEQDLAFVPRLLPNAVERGAYEYMANFNRVLYYDPDVTSTQTTDGLSWENPFGQGDLQGAINLASLYNSNHPGEQAYVYAKGGETNETITLTNGVNVNGSVPAGMPDCPRNEIKDDKTGEITYEITDDQAAAYETLIQQTRPGIAGPNANPTIVDGITASGTYDQPAVVDGVEVSGDLNITGDVKTTGHLDNDESKPNNNGALVIKNTIVHAPEGATEQTLSVDNALIYNVLFRDNLVDLKLGQNAYAAHVTSTEDIVFASNNQHADARVYYNNVKYAGSSYKWNDYPDLNYQLDETSDMIDAADDGDKEKTQYQTIPANLRAYINIWIDRDVLGNPRLLGGAEGQDKKSDIGCFEMWRVDAPKTAQYQPEAIYCFGQAADATTHKTSAEHVWRYFPHEGSDVYLMETGKLRLSAGEDNTGSLKGLTIKEDYVEPYQMLPGFLLVKEGGSLYGQGNVVNVPYIATEQTIRPEGNLVALPYRHNYDGVSGLHEGNYAGDNGSVKTYDAEARSNWKYYYMADNSKCWKTFTGEVPAMEGVNFKLNEEFTADEIQNGGKLHRFTSKASAPTFQDYRDYLYTELKDATNKVVVLTQNNAEDANGQLTSKENMGWNLFGIPYLVSEYKTYADDPSHYGCYMMQMPKELWLFYNGSASPDGLTTSLNEAGYYSVTSWDAAGFHQGNNDTPRLWTGEGIFTQTAVKTGDSEDLTFQLPDFDLFVGSRNNQSAPELRNVRWIVNDSIEEAQPADQDGMIFDLQGRRVQEPQHGKVYLINGKKVMFQ